MSRIYFHSPSGTVEIYGRERAWMSCLCDDIANGVIFGRETMNEHYVPFLPPDCFALRDLRDKLPGWYYLFTGSLKMWARYGNSWIVDNENYDCWQLGINTVLAIGSDPLKLCARLHSQCELHAFVEGPNRRWLAGIIREGIGSDVMRDGGYGPPSDYRRGQWSALASWLASRDNEPVVCSYSVCEQFPNPSVAIWESDDPDDDNESWYTLPADERWRLGMAGLRSSTPYTQLELKPDGWDLFRVGHCKDGFWLTTKVSEYYDL